ncbi:protein-L-isoaspartate(D-aspartate) O-methyltransferase [Ectothiorhodospiraceae bacterium BW-2]|nr:protein-L-isoaspartate(D-aspartate) O-methyltransferase [Ectothiorhodospiraceae bacterium BW-2]
MTSQRTRDRLRYTLQQRGITNQQVLEVIASTPRHLFVDEALSHRAYEETTLPIGYGQTISRPYTVARMTELLLEVRPRKVLEIGSGCGYQTAILASLIAEVYTIERIGALYTRARNRLTQLGFTNIRLRHGDGYEGWPQQQPFDAIIVAAAPPQLPQTLLQQLAEGGVMVLPLGSSQQQLHTLYRQGGEFHDSVVEAASFVPMLTGAMR